MNAKDFAPLVGALLKAGSPAIAGALTLALTPAIGPLAPLVGGGVGDILPRIAMALGAPDDATPQTLADKVDADPDAAQTALAQVEAEHKFTIDKAAQDQAYLLQTQSQQLQVNTTEAQNPSMFVAGWRPAIGWGLGGLVLATFVLPYPVWVLAAFGVHLPPPPVLDPQAIYILSGLLGITVAARSIDKLTGTASPAIGGVSKIVKTTVRGTR